MNRKNIVLILSIIPYIFYLVTSIMLITNYFENPIYLNVVCGIYEIIGILLLTIAMCWFVHMSRKYINGAYIDRYIPAPAGYQY